MGGPDNISDTLSSPLNVCYRATFKKERTMIIIGAGIAGLIAANTWQDAPILEAKEEGAIDHKALLRFRTPLVGDYFGIEFKPVTVRKAIWDDGFIFEKPSIKEANEYSYKVTGKILERSIWNLEPCTRYIAPHNFLEQLRDRFKSRISYNTPIWLPDYLDCHIKINTMPLSQARGQYGLLESCPIVFSYSPIKVRRYKIRDCDVYQTVYFPDPEISLYRASITGDILIMEYIRDSCEFDIEDVFGVTIEKQLEEVSQVYGKITPIQESWRRKLLLELNERGVYSLGRFATWRNILSDDLLKDVTVIKKLIEFGKYDRVKRTITK